SMKLFRGILAFARHFLVPNHRPAVISAAPTSSPVRSAPAIDSHSSRLPSQPFTLESSGAAMTSLKRDSRWLGVALGLAVTLLTYGSAHAALTLKTWKGVGTSGGTGGTDFNTAANWNPGTVPRASDSCVMTLTSGGAVTLSADATVGALTASVS